MQIPKRDIDAEIEVVKARTRKCAAEIEELAEDAPEDARKGMLNEVDNTIAQTKKRKEDVETQSGVISPEHAKVLRGDD